MKFSVLSINIRCRNETGHININIKFKKFLFPLHTACTCIHTFAKYHGLCYTSPKVVSISLKAEYRKCRRFCQTNSHDNSLYIDFQEVQLSLECTFTAK